MLLNYVEDNTWLKRFENGGTATMERIESCKEQIPLSTYVFLRIHVCFMTPLNFSLFIVAHPQICLFQSRSKMSRSIAVFYGTETEPTFNQSEKTVIFGHTPVRSPIQKPNMIGIDTGCVYPQFGKLTAVSLRKTFFSTKRMTFNE